MCANIVFFGREPATFVKELIYRSLERQNLDKVYRQIQELRKRLRTREQKAVRAGALSLPDGSTISSDTLTIITSPEQKRLNICWKLPIPTVVGDDKTI